MRQILRLTALLFVMTIGSTRAGAQVAGACGPADNHFPTAVLNGLRRFLPGTQPTDSLVRLTTHLPAVPADSIRLVADSAVCAAAARAVAARVGPTAEIWPVWVIAVGGSRFVAFDTRLRSNGAIFVSIFDAAFNWIADYRAT
jgi:hypothetical protein